jgi:hypothetical protein
VCASRALYKFKPSDPTPQWSQFVLSNAEYSNTQVSPSLQFRHKISRTPPFVTHKISRASSATFAAHIVLPQTLGYKKESSPDKPDKSLHAFSFGRLFISLTTRRIVSIAMGATTCKERISLVWDPLKQIRNCYRTKWRPYPTAKTKLGLTPSSSDFVDSTAFEFASR